MSASRGWNRYMGSRPPSRNPTRCCPRCSRSRISPARGSEARSEAIDGLVSVRNAVLRSSARVLESNPRRTLSRQVVEDELPRGQVRNIGHPALAYDLLEHENEPRHPALRLLVELLPGKLGACVIPLIDDCVRLLPGEPQRIPAHDFDLAVHSQAGHRRRRFGAAQHHHAAFGRRLGDRNLDHPVERRLRSELVVVVEHQHEGFGAFAEKGSEVTPGEGRQRLVVLGRKARQGTSGIPSGVAAQVVEECGDVRVVGVDLVPARVEPAFAEVARNEGGLAAPRSGIDPYPGRSPRMVEQLEESLPGEHSGESGRAGLCEFRARRHRRAPFRQRAAILSTRMRTVSRVIHV